MLLVIYRHQTLPGRSHEAIQYYPKALGALVNTDKKPHSCTSCHQCRIPYPPPPPFHLEHCWFVYGTLEGGVHVKFSHYINSPKNQHGLKGGGGGESPLQNTKSAKSPWTFGDYCRYH